MSVHKVKIIKGIHSTGIYEIHSPGMNDWV
jgi:hypothetical protein